MGYKSAAQILEDEINHINRRIERIEHEIARLRDAGLLTPLKEEHLSDRISALHHDRKKAEEQLLTRKGEQGARHISDFRNGRGNGTGSLERPMTAAQRRWINFGDKETGTGE